MTHIGFSRGAHNRYLGAGLDFIDFLHIQKTTGVETIRLGGGKWVFHGS